jgi:two-component system nitrogen regulation response regulator GlnG
VRELENLMRRVAVLYSQPVIGADIIEAELAGALPQEPDMGGRAESLSEATGRHLRQYFAAHQPGLPASGLYDRVLREIERPLLAIALEATRGNQIKAAELLGINRNTLRKKIRELDIEILRSLR